MKNIIVAESQGFCWGVRRALDIVNDHGELSILGDLIHNKQVVKELEKNHKKIIKEIYEDEKNPIVITAHGTEIANIRKLTELDKEIVDTTCPLVSAIYKAGRQLEDQGYKIVIIGDRNHVEVKGIASRMNGPIIINDEEELREIEFPERVGIICQSTFSVSKFEIITSLIKEKVTDVEVRNTICSPTKKRQKAAEELAQFVDIMIVVGGYHSSNTKKLFSLANKYVQSYHIEVAEQLDASWFKGKLNIGIIAGASTADWLIEEVRDKINKFEV